MVTIMADSCKARDLLIMRDTLQNPGAKKIDVVLDSSWIKLYQTLSAATGADGQPSKNRRLILQVKLDNEEE